MMGLVLYRNEPENYLFLGSEAPREEVIWKMKEGTHQESNQLAYWSWTSSFQKYEK